MTKSNLKSEEKHAKEIYCQKKANSYSYSEFIKKVTHYSKIFKITA